MFFSKLVLAIVLAAGSAVEAFPNPNNDWTLGGIYERKLINRAIPPGYKMQLASAIAHFGPKRSHTMMHSGIGAKRAAQLARSMGRQTVETTLFKAVQADFQSKKNEYKDTLAKYCVPKEEFCGPRGGSLEEWKEFWAASSEAWASYAEGSTTLATTTAGPAANSFYTLHEQGILQKNGVKINVDVVDGSRADAERPAEPQSKPPARPNSPGGSHKKV